MGVLVVANELAKPSHLWMRRQLRGLGRDVVCLVASGEIAAEYRGRYRCIALQERPAMWRRIANLAGLTVASGASRRNQHRLARALSSPDVSAVLLHYVNRAVQYRSVLEKTSKPILVHCHGYDVTWDLCHLEGPRIGERFHPPGYEAAVRDLPRNFTFIANSGNTRKRLESIGVAPDRIHVKHLGVEVSQESPRRESDGEGLRLLYLGRLVDCKGPDLVIRAFELACQRGMDGHLTLAGDGPLRLTCELLRSRSRFRDRISLVGAVEEAAAERLWAQADVFVAHHCVGPVSRQEEAFGVGVVEAMAAGLPVVSAKSGSLTELVTDGTEGILVQPGDVEAHASALERLARDRELRMRMGTAGRERARECFSLESEIELLRALLGV